MPQEKQENDISKLILSELGDLNNADKEKIDAMNKMEKGLEESLLKAETVIDGIQMQLQTDSTSSLSDKERLKALEDSIAKLNIGQEKVSNKKKKNSKKMDMIQEQVEKDIQKVISDNKIFSLQTESESEIQDKRNKYLESKKANIKTAIMKEKQYFKKPTTTVNDIPEIEASSQVFLQEVDERQKVDEEFMIKEKEALMRVEEVINEQIKNDQNQDNSPLIQKFDDKINGDGNEQKTIIQDVVDNILESDSDSDEDLWYTDSVNETNQQKTKDDQGKKLDDLRKEFDNETRIAELEQEVDDLLQKGDELNEKFLEQNNYLETLIENDLQKTQPESEESISFEFSTEDEDLQSIQEDYQADIEFNQDSETLSMKEDVNKKQQQEKQDNENSFYKQIAFSIVLVLALLFMIFGSQFDLFSFFSQRRRAKDPFYRDDEAQQSLLN